MTDPAPVVLNDRYELRSLIGRGGMAEVYRAADLLLDREVAVKLMRPSGGGEVDRKRFASEMRLLAALNHPNLVTLLDAGVEQTGGSPRPWLAMELVTGPTLAHRLAEAPLSPGEVADVGADLAAALAHVHANGIVHRDVKPANVLITPDGSAKLADFGVARLRDEQSELTAAGYTIGTAAYLAPEQVTGGPVTGAADVYALGLIILEALTGRRAYTGPPVEAAVARLHHAPLIPVSLGAGWVRLLDAMLASDPAERPGADEAAQRLSTLHDGGAVVATEPAGTGPIEVPATTAIRLVGTAADERRTGRRPVLLGAAAATAVLLTVGLGWISTGGADPAAPPAGAAEVSATQSARKQSDKPSAAPARTTTSETSAPEDTRTRDVSSREKRPVHRAEPERHRPQQADGPDKRKGNEAAHPGKSGKAGKGQKKGRGKGHGKGHGRGR